MKLYSPTIGIALDLSDSGELLAGTNLVSMEKLSQGFLKNATALVNDWEILQQQNAHDTDELAKAYHLSRAIDYTIFLLQNRSSISTQDLEAQSLTRDLLEEIDSILQNELPAETYIDRLLLAPLRQPTCMKLLQQDSSGLGLTALVACFEEVLTLQELLTSFVDSWIDAVSELICSGESETNGSRVWRLINSTGIIRSLLHAGNRHEFQEDWTSILFSISDIELRQYANRLGIGIANRRWRELDPPRVEDLGEGDQEILAGRSYPQPNAIHVDSSHEAYERVKSQIKHIVELVSKGKDQKARQVMNQLVSHQMRTDNGKKFAIKSLCNIAQQCADLYRLDYERECLDRAFEIDDKVVWAHIQLADHYKRKGEYENSLRTIERAKQFSQDLILYTLMADVYAQQGQLDDALAVYESVTEPSAHVKVEIAIADLVRKMGDLDRAAAVYDKVIADREIGNQSELEEVLRARAGLAEIKKQQGFLEEARKEYEYICSFLPEDNRAGRIFKMALCDILKRLERYDDAFRVVDDVVRDAPFFLQARYLRGALLGLRGQYLEGLNDFTNLPKSESFGSWLSHYYMGLLYLGLDRFDESREKLLNALQAALAAPEDKDLVRMSAAVYYLALENVIDAEQYLPEEITSRNHLTRFLWITLKYHISSKKKDATVPKELEAVLLHDGQMDKDVLAAAEAIKKSDFSSAVSAEIQLLLRSASCETHLAV